MSRALAQTNAGLSDAKPGAAPAATSSATSPTTPTSEEAQNSPLARFRSFPRKPLSVSDLTSGAWCELQYEYTLTRLPFGRRTRTAAMRAGTKVHAQLEDEVHTTVHVDVAAREDFFGIKLWNMIQGLRTLREMGLTRELEIWGVVDAGGDDAGLERQQVVNGVIDALSYQDPDPATGDGAPVDALPATTSPSRSRITDFFPSSQPSSSQNGRPPPPRKIYITDIKTRGTPRLPSGAAVRPAKIQLFLYHRFLTDLATGRLDFGVLFRRYALDPDASFSDSFLAQIGELHDEIFADITDTPSAAATPNQEDSLIRYRTLRSLVELLQAEVALTFPHGAASIGDVVAVEYRLRPAPKPETSDDSMEDDDSDNNSSSEYDPDSGRCIGTNVMPVDNAVLDRYLTRYLAWWRGARPAVGVEIEEAALKCGYCEFAADCDWRRALDAARVQRVRARMAKIGS